MLPSAAVSVTRERQAELDAVVARYRAGQLDEDGNYLGPPVTERCAYCPFVVTAPVGQARDAWAEHDCDRPRPAKRQRSSGFTIR